MMTSLFVALLLYISGQASPPPRPMKPCREHPKLTGACFKMRGRMNFYNGGTSVRIWQVGTKRILGVGMGSSFVEGYNDLPQEILDKLSWDSDLFGDFVVCPLTKERPNVMQLVCVDSAARMKVGRRDTTSGQAISTPESPQPRTGACLRESATLVGAQPVQVGKNMRAPKKLKNVPVAFPKLPSSTTVQGLWVGEALIDQKGTIREVWTIRRIRVRPPEPAFNEAIVNAIRSWVFEPLVVDGKAVPVCMTVTMNIDF